MTERYFSIDSEGTVQENDLTMGKTVLNLKSQELKVTLDDGSIKRFYVDRQGYRVLDVDSNEWTQLDPDLSPEEFIQSKST